MDDVQAIRRLKRGDMGGLETLMIRYQVRATRAAFLITHDEAVAQDVVQETFIRIYQRIRQFNESHPFEPYLMRSIINASLNAVRGNARIVFFDSDSTELENLLDLAASVESQIEFVQLQRKILDVLSKLSPRQRAVIVQRYYLDMSEQDMAIALDVAPGTVKWLLNAARERLRQLLGQKGEPNE
jgi:RNA polymerase sigma-70 factor (ECF subfamily)